MYSTGSYHVLPDVNSVPQKKLHIGAELIRPNFHFDFKWCMWIYSMHNNPVFYFSSTRIIAGPVWRVENYLCVETTLRVMKTPTLFKNRTNFECRLT